MSVKTVPDTTEARKAKETANRALGVNPTLDRRRKAQAYVLLKGADYKPGNPELSALGVQSQHDAERVIEEIEHAAKEAADGTKQAS